MVHRKGTLQFISMKSAVSTLTVWACIAHIAAGLVLERQDPDPAAAATKFEEESVAKDYMENWKKKSWESARRSCDVSKLPKTTGEVIYGICGKDADHKRCICNLAKAHSCHVGCRKLPPVCPPGCQEKKCFQGAPSNGGEELSGGGHKGQCYKYCSPVYSGVRYCGAGPDYQNGLFMDCTGCKPVNPEKMTAEAKRERWTMCMSDCFPTPSCAEMCVEGNSQCYSLCLENYRYVVEPYWDIFKGSLRAVPLLSKSAEKSASEEPVAETLNMVVQAKPWLSNQTGYGEFEGEEWSSEMADVLKKAQVLGLT